MGRETTSSIREIAKPQFRDTTAHVALQTTEVAGRHVTVYVPPAFEEHPAEPYPLLVLHDGQNLFVPERAHAGEPWRAGETVDRLIAQGDIPPIVICGIDHAGPDRIREFTPTPGPRRLGGDAADYARMVIEEVLPFMRATYPVRRDRRGTALGGSSLGGLVTLYMGIVHPQEFGALMAMSPSIWWDRRYILRLLAKHPETLADTRLWLDVGRKEGAVVVADVQRFSKQLRTLGLKTQGSRSKSSVESPSEWSAGSSSEWSAGSSSEWSAGSSDPAFRFVEDPNGDHSEKSWGRRLASALRFIYPTSSDTPARRQES
jgi:enterochelin esterase-like enzyme